jgi:rod shape-determining protein MreD
MRWPAYFILGYLALGLQIGLAPALQFQNAAPNLVLICVVFIAVNATREPALLACFGLGFLQDMLTQQPLGLFAFSYGLAGMFVVSTQELVYREHPLTHFSVTLAAGLLVGAVMLVHGWIRPPAPAVHMDGGQVLSAVRISPLQLFTTALYSAVLAVPVLAVLQRIKKIFSFDAARRKARMP